MCAWQVTSCVGVIRCEIDRLLVIVGSDGDSHLQSVSCALQHDIRVSEQGKAGWRPHCRSLSQHRDTRQCNSSQAPVASPCAKLKRIMLFLQRGAFDIGATVYPIAIKYNKIFVDAFWNSRKQSFTAHLVRRLHSSILPALQKLQCACPTQPLRLGTIQWTTMLRPIVQSPSADPAALTASSVQVDDELGGSVRRLLPAAGTDAA